MVLGSGRCLFEGYQPGGGHCYGSAYVFVANFLSNIVFARKLPMDIYAESIDIYHRANA